MSIFLAVIGWICVIYFLCIALFVRHGTFFFFVWLFLGVVALGLSFCMKRGIWQEHVPLLVRRSFWCVATIGVLFFLIVEGFILSGFGMSGSDQAKYLVVLGAQMKPEGPSKVLQYRLDAALAYLTDHPECQVVVSGGQGADEHISEAQGMYDYLVAHGLEADRILLEDQSVNMVQNLAFSAKYFDKEKDEVLIVSNNFHVFRAVGIARRQGYQKVSGLAARGYWFLLPNNMLREFVGVCKDLILGI